MGDRIFTAQELLEVADIRELPGSVRYAAQRGGSPSKGLGIILARAPGVTRVGQRQHVALYQIEARS